MARPQTWLKATHRAKEAQQIVSTQTQKPSFIPYTSPTKQTPTPLKI